MKYGDVKEIVNLGTGNTHVSFRVYGWCNSLSTKLQRRYKIFDKLFMNIFVLDKDPGGNV